jgi:hypothetical protein
MTLIYPRCCVLAIQGQTVLACLRIQDTDGPAHDEVRTFAILPAELVTLSDWLAAHGVTHVAIESTNHAWKPIYHILRQTFTVLLIDAGRVTDVKDIGRIASLLAYGLEPCRVIPPTPLQEPSPRHRRRLITVGAMMLAAVLASYWVWTHPSRMDSDHLPVPPPSGMVRWQQSAVSYQHPAGQHLALSLPKLKRSPEDVPVEVTLDASGDRPSWLQFDRERLSMRGMAPSTAKDQTYQLIFLAQAEHGSQSRLQVSLTIRGRPEPPLSSVSTDAPSPPPSQASEPLPSQPSSEQAQLLTILKEEPPDSSVSTEAPPPLPSQASEPLPSEPSPAQAQLLKIFTGDPPPSSVPTEALPLPPLPPPRVPKPLSSDRPLDPIDKNCVVKILKGEPCLSSR